MVKKIVQINFCHTTYLKNEKIKAFKISAFLLDMYYKILDKII